MQPMDGFDTIKELKKDWPDMKVLAFSMFETEMHILKMLFHGANGYIYKNSNPKELIIAIETLYEYEYYYNDAATRKMVYEIKNKLIKLPKLTEAEIEVLRYHCKGHTYMKTAEKIGTSLKSVQGHMDSLHNKLNIHKSQNLFQFAIQFGYFHIDTNIDKDEWGKGKRK